MNSTETYGNLDLNRSNKKSKTPAVGMDAFSLEDQSFIHYRTTELAVQHRKYLEQHPELTQLLHDFVTNCLVNKVNLSINVTHW